MLSIACPSALTRGGFHYEPKEKEKCTSLRRMEICGLQSENTRLRAGTAVLRQ